MVIMVQFWGILVMCLLPYVKGSIDVKCPINQTVHDGASLSIVAKATGVPDDHSTFTVQLFGQTPDQKIGDFNIYSFYENGGMGGANASYLDYPHIFSVREERVRPGELDITLTINNISHWANGPFRFLIHLSPPPLYHLGVRCNFYLTVTMERKSTSSVMTPTNRNIFLTSRNPFDNSGTLHPGTSAGIGIAVIGVGAVLAVVARVIISSRTSRSAVDGDGHGGGQDESETIDGVLYEVLTMTNKGQLMSQPNGAEYRDPLLNHPASTKV
ncbi:uncharacterized protein LOC144879263 [Branchiostoma floridae x Branchiostoma japonicum]